MCVCFVKLLGFVLGLRLNVAHSSGVEVGMITNTEIVCAGCKRVSRRDLGF